MPDKDPKKSKGKAAKHPGAAIAKPKKSQNKKLENPTHEKKKSQVVKPEFQFPARPH